MIEGDTTMRHYFFTTADSRSAVSKKKKAIAGCKSLCNIVIEDGVSIEGAVLVNKDIDLFVCKSVKASNFVFVGCRIRKLLVFEDASISSFIFENCDLGLFLDNCSVVNCTFTSCNIRRVYCYKTTIQSTGFIESYLDGQDALKYYTKDSVPPGESGFVCSSFLGCVFNGCLFRSMIALDCLFDKECIMINNNTLGLDIDRCIINKRNSFFKNSVKEGKEACE